MSLSNNARQEPDLSNRDKRDQILQLVAEYCSSEHAPRPFVKGQSPVPVSGRVYDAADMCSLVESALDFWLTTGEFNTVFEKKLSTFIGTKFALTCNSGSSANLLAMTALTSPLLKDKALKPGDEVITCATGFPTTVNPILMNGLVPVFLDVDIPTYNMDVTKLEEAISPKTRAIMIAHTLGNPFNLDAVMEVAKKHDLYVVEDCCDALGATYRGRMVGTFGNIGTLSFYPAHHITMGEGGAVFTNRSLLKRSLESFRDWGRDCYCGPGEDNTCGRRYEWKLGELPEGYDHKYTYSHLGYNLKITDMQAAVGVSQMDKLETFIAARRRNFDLIKNGMKARGLDEFLILPEATEHSNPSWFGYPTTVREGAPFERDALLMHLNDKRIGTRLLFGGNLLRQPYMIGRPYRQVGEMTVSDRVMRDTFWLGVFPGLEAPAIEYMLDTIDAFVKSH